MPDLDSAAVTEIEGGAFAPAWFIYLDISGDPLRVTNTNTNVTFSSTGDADLDGNTFVAFGGKFLSVGDISNSDSGSDSLSITLSGIKSMDITLMNDIGDKSKWQGRLCRVWTQIYDATGKTKKGAVAAFKTGYMSSVSLKSTPKGQVIDLSVENWLAAFNNPSFRPYLNQKDYDPADASASATIACANGLRRDSGAGSHPVPGAGRGGRDRLPRMMRQ